MSSQPHLWHLLSTINNRLVALESVRASPDAAPVPVPSRSEAPPVEVLKRLEDLERRLNDKVEKVKADLHASVVNERTLLDTKLTHKYDQLVSKLVREQVADLQVELECLIEKYSVPPPGHVVIDPSLGTAPLFTVPAATEELADMELTSASAKKAPRKRGGRPTVA